MPDALLETCFNTPLGATAMTLGPWIRCQIPRLPVSCLPLACSSSFTSSLVAPPELADDGECCSNGFKAVLSSLRTAFTHEGVGGRRAAGISARACIPKHARVMCHTVAVLL